MFEAIARFDINFRWLIVAARPHGKLTAADVAATTRIEQAARRVPGVTGVRDLGASADSDLGFPSFRRFSSVSPDGRHRDPLLVAAGSEAFAALLGP